MRIYAISDLHLPGGGTKAMEVFGSHWAGHMVKVERDWYERVAADDVVLLPGDFSWAMRLAEAAPELAMLGGLPGRKIMLRGNHDYWWNALGQVRAALPGSVDALQNDCCVTARCVIAGSRGWTYPIADSADYEEDYKIYQRELIRLDMSIKSAKKAAPSLPLVVMTHYPPFRERYEPSPVTRMIEESGAIAVVYGHLHGDTSYGIGGIKIMDCVTYYQVSCDGLGFKLREIMI